MPQNTRYAGKSIDLSGRRSIVIRRRESTETLILPNDNEITVDYFFHQGKYWTAVIPLDGVSEVYGQTFNFSATRKRRGKDGPEVITDRQGLPRRKIPMLNHLQSRFTLRADRPVLLYPLHDPECKRAALKINDFVYSFEAVGPPGVKFNFRDAFCGNLISAHRFLSTQEMVFERIVVENQFVTESPALPIPPDAKRELLVQSLLRSDRAGMTERYYLYRFLGTNNCTSNPFQILDKVVHYRLRHRIGSFLYRLPFNPRFYLRVRGLDADPRVRKLVRSEFTAYIEAADTQARKRTYVRRQIQERRAAFEQTNG